jgi:hypothetical protein
MYPNGWPVGIGASFAASRFTPPTPATTANPSPTNVLGLAGAPDVSIDNITVSLADGGLPGATSNRASIAANSRVTVPPVAAGASVVSNLALAFTPATGLMTGSFTHPVTGAIVSFSGVALQRTNSAAGYFIFTPAGSAANGGESVSGSIAVAATP